ncbi:MAG: hemolysin III family protein [Spirochaetales bacterium]|nr:hemolysin III family protein [Spirochaetales bacterium]
MKFENWLIKNISLHNFDNKKEEFINGLTHFVGIILSIIGIIFLLLKDTKTPNIKGAFVIYGFSMLLLYTASTIYHWLKNPILKRVGRILDHCNIYLLIAGTYTPLAFFVGGKIGINILIIEWVLTILGIIFTLRFWGRLKILHVIFYLFMGWMIVFIWNDFIQMVPKEFAQMILSGGIFYSVGVVIYALKKLPFYHGIWHVFVVLGSMSMYMAIFNYIK